MKRNIVFLHGIACHSFVMYPLENLFKSENYNVLNINYPSTRLPIEGCADFIAKEIDTFLDKNPYPTHFITYSMGGLVLRAYVKKYNPTFLDRTVMISPPNKGSELADTFKNMYLYKSFFGPAGQQLITNQIELHDKLAHTLPCDIGVITGSKCIDPVSAFFLDGEPHDGKVRVRSTFMKGMKDHMVVPVDHFMMTFNTTVKKQCLHFIQNGLFDKS